jgi:hypothetical protein
MPSGSILITSENLSDRIQDGLEWKRDSGNFPLVSVIQYMVEKFKLGRNRIAKKAMVIHQHVGTRHELKRNENGRYSILSEEAVITRWSNIIITPNYIVVDKKGNKVFVKEVITNALGLIDSINYLQLDTHKMSQDTKDHWTHHFDGRSGRVQTGTFFGDGIEQDPVFGKELKKSNTKAVGLVTRFFGNPAKVRISSEGGVTAYGNLEEEQFLKYIEAEILPYRIQLLVK